MNAQLKTILLTVLTLSLFVIALVELSGVSSTALFNKYGIGSGGQKRTMGTKEEQERIKQAESMPRTRLQFIPDTKYSFGKIREGSVVTHAFHFKNVGDHPLLIIKAEASCGCTIPSVPKAPIPPGGEGDITVQFDSHHRQGHQQKNVMVFSNAELDRMSIGFDVDVE